MILSNFVDLIFIAISSIHLCLVREAFSFLVGINYKHTLLFVNCVLWLSIQGVHHQSTLQ